MSAAKAFPSILTARTITGRLEIRDIVQAAKKSGLIHLRKPRKEAQPPKHKLQIPAKVFSQNC